MKKVSNLIVAIFSLISISFLASCSNVNVNSEPSLYIQLPGGNIGKAVTSDQITWFDVTVTNDQNSYSGGGYAGSIVEIERVVAGTYTVTCNGKLYKDSLISIYTDSRKVEVTSGENVVDMLLDKKYNGAGYLVWNSNTADNRMQYPSFLDFNFSSKSLLKDGEVFPFSSTYINNVSFDTNGGMYITVGTSSYKPYYTDGVNITQLSDTDVSSVHIDNATNKKYDIYGVQGILDIHSFDNLEAIVLEIGGSNGKPDYIAEYCAGEGKYTIYNNHLFGVFEGTDGSYLGVYKIPGSNSYQDVFHTKLPISGISVNNSDILVKDDAVYILFNKDESPSYSGVLLKYTINPDMTLTYAGKLGDNISYNTDYPYFYKDGSVLHYLYTKVGSNYQVLTYPKPDQKNVLFTSNDDSFFHRPVRFISSLPDCLAIADSAYVCQTKSNGEIEFKKKNRIIFIDLKKFEIADVKTLDSYNFAYENGESYTNTYLVDSLLAIGSFNDYETEFNNRHDLNNVYYKDGDEYKLLKNHGLKDTIQLKLGLPIR